MLMSEAGTGFSLASASGVLQLFGHQNDLRDIRLPEWAKQIALLAGAVSTG